MSQTEVFWFLPTHGDSRYLGTSQGARAVGYDYLKQIAVAADTLGYDGALIPTGRSCEDPWVAASSLIGATKQLRFLVAVRPGSWRQAWPRAWLLRLTGFPTAGCSSMW